MNDAAAFDVVTARLAWNGAGLGARRISTPTLDAAGAAVFVDGQRALFASPRADVAPAPYGPAIFDAMAAATADSDRAPLFVAPPSIAFADALSALAPLLASHQNRFRSVRRPEVPRELGVFGALVAATSVATRDVEIVLDPNLHVARKASDDRWLCFVLIEKRLRYVALWRDASGFSVDASLSGSIELDESDQPEAVRRTDRWSGAVLAVAPETSIDTLDRALDRLASVQLPYPYGRDNHFARFVVTPARATLEKILPRY
jgi:hypothetical protein